jgi:hypothetical protein
MTKNNYKFLYSNFAFLDSRLEYKIFRKSFTRIQSPHNFLINQILLPKYMNCVTFSKDLLAIFILWFCPAFWWRDIYLLFSVFTSRLTSLLASIRGFCIFLYGMYLYCLPIGLHHQHRPESNLICPI